MNRYNLGDILYEISLEDFTVKEFIVSKIMISVPDKEDELDTTGVVYFAMDGHAMYENLLLPTKEFAEAVLKQIKKDGGETNEN